MEAENDFQHQFRPRACKASKVEKFGVNFNGTILLEEDSETVHPCQATSGSVFINTEYPIQFREMVIQFEGFLTMPFAKKFAGSIPGVRQSIVGSNRPEPGGYQLSPVNCVMVPDVGSLYTISEPETFPFAISPLLGNLQLPRAHDYSGCTLIYRFAVYMRSPCGIWVEICEKIIPNFDGYHNLNYNPVTGKHQYLEVQTVETLPRSMTPIGKVSLTVGRSGYLPGDSIPFEIDFQCYYRVQVDCYVQLKSQIKIGVFFEGSGVWQTKTAQKLVKPKKSFTWTDKLEIPLDSAPSCNAHPMITTSNAIEFKVIIVGKENLTGSVPVYIGTTRRFPSPVPSAPFCAFSELQNLPAALSNNLRLSSSPSLLSLPPPYSLLSSRTQSMETLPPPYESLEIPHAECWRRRSHSDIPESSAPIGGGSNMHPLW